MVKTQKYEVQATIKKIETKPGVNLNQFPIEGEEKTYDEIRKKLNGGDNKYTKKWNEGHKARDYNYGSGGYYQGNNITFNCLRCGLHVKNGIGYRGFKTIEEFEKEREESAKRYSNYKSKKDVPYGLYCEVDSDLKGYNGAYVKGNIEAYGKFDGGRDNRCGSSNFCMGDKKGRENFLNDEKSSSELKKYLNSLGKDPQCLTDFAWEEGGQKVMESYPMEEFEQRANDYQAYRVGFEEGRKDKEDICEKADELRGKNYREMEKAQREA